MQEVVDQHVELHREFFIGNLLVRNNFIIVMIRWIGLAPGRTGPLLPDARLPMQKVADHREHVHGCLGVRIHFIIVKIRWTGLGERLDVVEDARATQAVQKPLLRRHVLV